MCELERILEIEREQTKEFQYVGKVLEEVRCRLFGNAVGFAQEVITLSELKTGCPYDRFSEELSTRHGTDILAFVREGGVEISKISISVKRHKKWNSNFLNQLEQNIKDDQLQWGLLVTTVFPNEALNENIWTTFDTSGRLILMVKPLFVTAAYYAIRQMVIYQHLLYNTLIENSILEGPTANINLNSLHAHKKQNCDLLRSEK